MSSSSYYDQAATQHETSADPMHSGTQGYGQDVRQGMNEQQHGFPQQGYNEQSGDGIYSGQKPNTGNTNYAQGAQQMEGKGAQGAVADDRDTLTKCNDNPPDYMMMNFRKCLFGDRMLNSLRCRTMRLARAGSLLTAAVQNHSCLTCCACVYDST